MQGMTKKIINLEKQYFFNSDKTTNENYAKEFDKMLMS